MKRNPTVRRATVRGIELIAVFELTLTDSHEKLDENSRYLQNSFQRLRSVEAIPNKRKHHTIEKKNSCLEVDMFGTRANAGNMHAP